MILYTYFRSSAAYRVRIALGLKGLSYEPRFVHLLKSGGAQHDPAYLGLNPQGLVPSLMHGELVLTQSLAIIEYLDEVFPAPPLLPADPVRRAAARALAQVIACDVHPLHNLRVRRYLCTSLRHSEAELGAWQQHWIMEGLGAFERHLANLASAARYCVGDAPTLADLCLIPQVYAASRWGCDLGALRRINRVYEHCMRLPAFSVAAPEAQPDAEDS
ncbi:MAG: maleylacetoacetate isomerase [Gammaproteobacteria bacterium]